MTDLETGPVTLRDVRERLTFVEAQKAALLMEQNALNALIDIEMDRIVSSRRPVALMKFTQVTGIFGGTKIRPRRVDEVWPLDFELPASGPVSRAHSHNDPADRLTRLAIAQMTGPRQWGSTVLAHNIVPIKLVEGNLIRAQEVVLDFRHDDPVRNLATSELLLNGLKSER
jgi:hypothetical protein